MKYIIHKKVLSEQIRALHRRGGHFQKASEKVNSIIGAIETMEQPLHGLNPTNHGETRIKHCIKYDLNGFCRLITIQENNVCAFIFLGDHEECERWLNSKKGKTLVLDENQAVIGLSLSENVEEVEDLRKVNGIISDYKLIDKLKNSYIDFIGSNVNGNIFRRLLELDSFSSEDEIFDICIQIESVGFKEMMLDILLELKTDDLDNAKNRIRLFQEELQKISEISQVEITNIVSNDEYLVLDDFRGKDLENLINSSSWFDWMLFMHPQQRRVVDNDYNGPARLLGVSGSGKTCMVVNRAIRLAKKYPGEKILVTTINLALAKLIQKLIEIASSCEDENAELVQNIEVLSFWELSRRLLLENETDPILRRSYNLFSDKHLDDVDSVWREFYFKENNNADSEILQPVHQSLLFRNVLPLEYVKQEFDWIRSAIPINDRESYLTMERGGRSEPLTNDFRKVILEGLEFWENKMHDVGVCDFLGLIGPLTKFSEQITPRYRCVLVDELQDFGTTELSVIRKLVEHAENDLFLCGDIAQQVHTKHQMISKAGIQILPTNYLKITKNYRNSREILEAASEVFNRNVEPDQYNTKEFELLNPEYANFSSPKPFIRSADSLDAEFNFAFNYLNETLDLNEKGCIAFCGLTFFQVKGLSDRFDLSILDGEYSIEAGRIFISDLDQTKGFEFDRVIIINCCDNIFPNPKLPSNEWFREISKLYVSMTRAKKELIISYSGKLSHVFDHTIDYFNISTFWPQYVDVHNLEFAISLISNSVGDVQSSSLTGMEYLYTTNAIGLSGQAQDKLLSIITGRRVVTKFVPEECRTIKEFIDILNNARIRPQVTKLIGPTVINELRNHFKVN